MLIAVNNKFKTHKFTIDEFYSLKKKSHFINIFVVISPGGCILYVLPAYLGSTSDHDICFKTKEHWYNYFAQSENGMGDAGFANMHDHGWNFDSPQMIDPVYLAITLHLF